MTEDDFFQQAPISQGFTKLIYLKYVIEIYNINLSLLRFTAWDWTAIPASNLAAQGLK